jgi:transposase
MIDAAHAPINEWEPAAVNNELGEGGAHVWRASLDQPADMLAKFAPRLSKDEYQGHINRLKTLKRAMYRRAKFDLLRIKILAGSKRGAGRDNDQ